MLYTGTFVCSSRKCYYFEVYYCIDICVVHHATYLTTEQFIMKTIKDYQTGKFLVYVWTCL